MEKDSVIAPEREADEDEREGVGEGVGPLLGMVIDDDKGDMLRWEELDTTEDNDDDDCEDDDWLDRARYDFNKLLRGFSLDSVTPGAISTFLMVTPDPPVALRLIETLDTPPTTDDLVVLEGGVAPGMLARDSRLCSC